MRLKWVGPIRSPCTPSFLRSRHDSLSANWSQDQSACQVGGEQLFIVEPREVGLSLHLFNCLTSPYSFLNRDFPLRSAWGILFRGLRQRSVMLDGMQSLNSEWVPMGMQSEGNLWKPFPLPYSQFAANWEFWAIKKRWEEITWSTCIHGFLAHSVFQCWLYRENEIKWTCRIFLISAAFKDKQCWS